MVQNEIFFEKSKKDKAQDEQQEERPNIFRRAASAITRLFRRRR